MLLLDDGKMYQGFTIFQKPGGTYKLSHSHSFTTRVRLAVNDKESLGTSAVFNIDRPTSVRLLDLGNQSLDTLGRIATFRYVVMKNIKN